MGRMTNGGNFMKYILIVFNVVFMIYSLLLIGLGVALSLKWSALIELLPMGEKTIVSMPPWVPWMVFFVGLIMFLICILGCCGASNETYYALVTYAILLFGVIIFQVILGVLIYIGISFGETPVQVYIRSEWNASIPPQNAPEEEYSAFYDKLRTKSYFNNFLIAQEMFNCCGVYGKSDYSVSGKSLSVLDKSCCPAEVEKCTPDEAYDDGCMSKVNAGYKSWLEWALIIKGVAIGFVCLQVMLAASALYVAKATRKI